MPCSSARRPAEPPVAGSWPLAGDEYAAQSRPRVRRLLTDDSGRAVGALDYDPFGAPTWNSDTHLSPLGCDGQYTDAETGLVWLRARYYEATTGVFLTRIRSRTSPAPPTATRTTTRSTSTTPAVSSPTRLLELSASWETQLTGR